MKVVYLTSGTILIGRFSDRLKVGRFWIRGRRRQALVFSRIGLRPHRSWPLFARRSDINRAPALQAIYIYILGRQPAVAGCMINQLEPNPL